MTIIRWSFLQRSKQEITVYSKDGKIIKSALNSLEKNQSKYAKLLTKYNTLSIIN